MKYKDINIGEFFKWNGLFLMKLDDSVAVVVNHPTQSGTTLFLEPYDEVVSLNCELTFTKKEE